MAVSDEMAIPIGHPRLKHRRVGRRPLVLIIEKDHVTGVCHHIAALFCQNAWALDHRRLFYRHRSMRCHVG